MVSAWDRKTGNLLYQVSTLSSTDTIYIDLHYSNAVDTDMCAGTPTWKRSFGHGSGSRWKLSMKLDDFSFTFSSASIIVP